MNPVCIRGDHSLHFQSAIPLQTWVERTPGDSLLDNTPVPQGTYEQWEQKAEGEVQHVGMQGYACVLLQSCQALPERAKDKGKERRAGRMRDECPDQGFSNKWGTTQPLLNHQLSPRLANKEHHGSLMQLSFNSNGVKSLLQAIKEMEQPIMTSLPGPGGRRKNKDHWGNLP